MNTIRKAVTTLGGIFLAVFLIAALAPKATRGVVAALVQVTNTNSNPVPVAVNTPVPFAANLCVQTAESICQSNTNYVLVPSTTPAGLPVKWLVIEQVSGLCTSDSPAPVVMTPDITFGFPEANTAQGHIQPFFYFNATPGAGGGNPSSAAVVDSNVRIYVAAGYFVYGGVGARPGSASALCSLSFTGHLE
jgi:hypothetical protein